MRKHYFVIAAAVGFAWVFSGSVSRASEVPFSKNIYFGDLHVHTTYSFDADLYSVPAFGDDGAHPPQDACDFARYCSQLDFFSLNDHAESFTPDRWRKTQSAAQACNAKYGDPRNPQTLAFAGWEWTQVGDTPATHYGHKNIVFPGLDDLPKSPIGALESTEKVSWWERFLAGGLKVFRPFSNECRYADILSMMGQLATENECSLDADPDPLKLPGDCRQNATDPKDLFAALNQTGTDYLSILHGTAWGMYAPPGSSIANQLDPDRIGTGHQTLFEIYSGHGDNEEYRDFPEGQAECPAPTANYLPCCWQAGEIMRSRCKGLSQTECDRRVELAKKLALEAGDDPFSVFLDAKPEEWLDCDQCRDCFKPVYNYRPKETFQYALALGDFDHLDATGRPLRFEFGVDGSSDNHSGRAGTGYKQFARKYMTDVRGYKNEWVGDHMEKLSQGTQRDPQMPQAFQDAGRLLDLLDVERGSSYFYLGGLVAVHAGEKTRDAIWEALKQKEVYGTSGPKILLWYYLTNSPEGIVPMGSKVDQAENPHFLVRAQGSFVQKPGCPADSIQGLGTKNVERLCRGECYNPSDKRVPIEAIEVVRIRPQRYRDEPVQQLIEDPWKRFDCPAGQDVCQVEFDDPDFKTSGRDTVYYVRALQAPTPAINGAQVRTRFDRDGNAVQVTPCFAEGDQTPDSDDCLAPVRERAWSSPIFVNQTQAPRID